MEMVWANLTITQNLEYAGCTKDFIKRYMSLQNHGKEKEQVAILESYREELVEQMHDIQGKLDCLDYLLFYKRKQTGGM